MQHVDCLTKLPSEVIVVRHLRQPRPIHIRDVSEMPGAVGSDPIKLPDALVSSCPPPRASVRSDEFDLVTVEGQSIKLTKRAPLPSIIRMYQAMRKDQGSSNRTVHMEVSTVRMILKSVKLRRAIDDDVHMLYADKGVGKVLSPDEDARIIQARAMSPQPLLLTVVVIFSPIGLRNSELRCARWSQVDFIKKTFQVTKRAKTKASALRIVPLSAAALDAFTIWRARWANLDAEDYIFPTEKLAFKGEGAVERGLMTGYAVDRSKPLGSWKTAWASAKETPKSNAMCTILDIRS